MGSILCVFLWILRECLARSYRQNRTQVLLRAPVDILFAALMTLKARTTWDDMSHDDVFFKAQQVVGFTGTSRFGQNTRVVSWKEAAEINDSVLKEALVIPSRTGVACAAFPPSLVTFRFSSSNSFLSTSSPYSKLVSPGSTTRTFLSI